MAWKRVSTSQDVDVSDFSGEQLLQGLIDMGWIEEAEAEALQKRRAAKEKKNVFLSADDTEFEEATYHLKSGRRIEALIHLERFLGRDWIGALQ